MHVLRAKVVAGMLAANVKTAQAHARVWYGSMHLSGEIEVSKDEEQELKTYRRPKDEGEQVY
jgi:hypothetical protein